MMKLLNTIWNLFKEGIKRTVEYQYLSSINR